MADPAGEVRFPGLQQVISAQFALGHGISPSVCSIQCAPQPPSFTPAPGALEFRFGNTRLRFFNCIIDDFHASLGPSGEIWTLQILDRRWMWRFAEPIWGQYNQRLENGEVARSDDPTEETELFAPSVKSPQELAKLCLAKMNEQGANVSELPNNVYPEVFWDFINPAEALQSLCESLGCRIVLQLDNTVAIRKAGKGRDLPRDPSVMEDSLTLDLQAKPDSIWCVCAPSRFQVDFKLEAVGLDTDGQLKPIDELSYTPDSGWSSIDLEHFNNIKHATAEKRELAKDTVFKWYRITCPGQIPGYGKLTHGIHQIILEDTQVEQTTDAATSVGAGQPVKRNKPAQVFGVWCPGNEDLKNIDTSLRPPADDTKTYTTGFSIDRERKLVRFSAHVFHNPTHTASNGNPDKIGGYQPAELVLRTACTVLQNGTLGIVRYTRSKKTGARNGAGPYQVRREDLILGSYPNYSTSPGTYRSQVAGGIGMSVSNNLAEVQRQADFYIQAAMDDFDSQIPQARTYAGLKAINPDGAIQQVAWFIGPQGAMTRASRNNEQVDLSISFQERRFQQKLQALLKTEQKNAVQAKRDRRRTG